MALSSERFENVVNPDEGIYVEMEGVMEVKGQSPILSIISIQRSATPRMTQTTIHLQSQRTSKISRRGSG